MNDFHHKRIVVCIIALLLLACSQVLAGPIKVRAVVDPRVELMSVIFHLAGNEEYNRCKSRRFTTNLEEHFKEYQSHPAVKMAAELREKRSVSYDAVMSIAVHIKDINTCAELVPFEPRPLALDSRWRASEAREFLALCSDFTKDTNFASFLKKNKPLYDAAISKLQGMVNEQVNFNWFDEFFGPRPDINFNLVISILNGPSNYGVCVKTGDKTQIYCILGIWNVGWFGWGNPGFNKAPVSTIVHEFSHSYCNPLVDKYMNQFSAFGEKFFPKVEEQMKNQAYGSWQTLVYESLVRACEVRYAYANSGQQYAERIAQYQISRGFLWTQELSQLLGEYEQHRDKYSTLEPFMPRVVEFFNEYGKTRD
jgi:hypothetical protein